MMIIMIILATITSLATLYPMRSRDNLTVLRYGLDRFDLEFSATRSRNSNNCCSENRSHRISSISII